MQNPPPATLSPATGPLRKMYEAAVGDEEAEEDLVARLARGLLSLGF